MSHYSCITVTNDNALLLFPSRYIIVLTSTDSKCPHSQGLKWQYYDGSAFQEDTNLKIECGQSK